jgi:hypothetical protein
VAPPSPNSELRRLSVFTIPWSGTRLNAALLPFLGHGGKRIGFRFSPYRVLRNRDWKPLGIGPTHGLIDRGFFLYEGSRAFVVCGRERVKRRLP